MSKRANPLGGDCGYCDKPVDKPNPDCVGTYHPCPTCMGDHDKPHDLCTDPWHRASDPVSDPQTAAASTLTQLREELSQAQAERTDLKAERDQALARVRELEREIRTLVRSAQEPGPKVDPAALDALATRVGSGPAIDWKERADAALTAAEQLRRFLREAYADTHSEDVPAAVLAALNPGAVGDE